MQVCRTWLTRLKIIQASTPTTATPKDIINLLRRQHLGLSYLAIRCRWLLRSIDVLVHGRADGVWLEEEEEEGEEEEGEDGRLDAEVDHEREEMQEYYGGCLRHVLQPLRVLDLSAVGLSSQEIAAIGRTIRLGGFPHLETIFLAHREPVQSKGLVPLIDALGAKGCPGLKKLDLANTVMTPRDLQSLSQAVSVGGLDSLEWLEMSSIRTQPMESLLVPLLDAIKQRRWSQLRHLDLSDNEMSWEEFRALGAALMEGAFNGLEELLLSNCATDFLLLSPIIDALEMRKCPNLRKLKLDDGWMAPQEAHLLAHGLASGAFRHLRELDLSFNEQIKDVTMAEVVRALASGNCSHLVSLSISNTGMGQEAGEAILAALRNRSWPALEKLLVTYNHGLPDTWQHELAVVLEGGGGRRLKELGVEYRTGDGVQHLSQVRWWWWWCFSSSS